VIETFNEAQKMSLNILIVDESGVIRSVIRRIVNLAGFELGVILAVEEWG